MKQYIYVLQEFMALAGYDTSRVKPNETDLVHLKEDEELLVIFNHKGSEDLFLIFNEDSVTITFGQWAEVVEGNTLESFEYVVEVIKNIVDGDYYVREIIFEAVEVAMLMSVETDQIINCYIQSGEEHLKSLSAFDFFASLDFSEAYFNQVHWNEEFKDASDEYYWWDEEDAEDLDDCCNHDDEMDEDEDHDHCCHHHHGHKEEDKDHSCSCGRHHESV